MEKFDGRVQPRMERMFGAIPLSDKATLSLRASILSNPLVIRPVRAARNTPPAEKYRMHR